MKKKFWLFFFFPVILNFLALCHTTMVILTSISPGHIITSGNDKKVYDTSTVVTFQESDGSMCIVPGLIPFLPWWEPSHRPGKFREVIH